MKQSRKVDLLHKIAHGQAINATPEEKKELKKYRISSYDAEYATKSNISAYVTAMDNRKVYASSFRDWCQNNGRGDRRRKGHSEKAIRAKNMSLIITAVFLGWFCWGATLYIILGTILSPYLCIILGGIISMPLLKFSRRWMYFNVVALPLLIIAIVTAYR